MPNGRQTKVVADEHNGAFNMSQIFSSKVGGDKNRDKRKFNIGLIFVRWPKQL